MTRLELATPSVTGWCSNQLSYTPTERRAKHSVENGEIKTKKTLFSAAE